MSDPGSPDRPKVNLGRNREQRQNRREKRQDRREARADARTARQDDTALRQDRITDLQAGTVEDHENEAAAQRSTAEHQKVTKKDQDELMDTLWGLVHFLVKLAKFKLLVLGVMVVVIIGVVFATTNNGNNISDVEENIVALDVTVTDAKRAAEEAREASVEARAELREAIRLVQSDPTNPDFMSRVEAGLDRIEEVNQRLIAIEALLEGSG